MQNAMEIDTDSQFYRDTNPVWTDMTSFYADRHLSNDSGDDSDLESSSTISSTPSLTELDSQNDKGGARKDSKRGSGASTPRDGVAKSFFRGDGEGVSRAERAVTPPGGSGKTATPGTPKSASKQDPKTLLSPKALATFDRKVLLNAKGAKAANSAPEIISLDDDEDDRDGPSDIWSSTFGLQKRSEASTVKRRQINDGKVDEEGRKKQKFEIQGGSGVMGDFMKEQKDKDAGGLTNAAAVAASIDLTTDTNGEVVDPENDRTVVLGRVELDGGVSPSVYMNNIPHLKPGAIFKESAKGDKWPPIKVRLVHEKAALIRVVDPMRQRFGTLDGVTATAIAPLMEAKLDITFSVLLLARKRKANEAPGDAVSDKAVLMIKMLAPKGKAKLIGRALSQRKVWLRDMPVTGNEVLHNPQNPATYARPSTGITYGGSGEAIMPVTTRTVEEVRTDVMNMFDSIINTEHLPEAHQPLNIKTELLSHQKQGLFFLLAREEDRVIPKESGGEVFHLWKPKVHANGKRVYYNVITGTEMPSKPPPIRGGILADMMGLGKTLSMLSVIVDLQDEAAKFQRCPPPIAVDAKLRTNNGATLLICPLSVVVNWENQIKEHVAPDLLKTYIFHGPLRTQKWAELNEYDLVITSYGTIAAEFKRYSSPLYQTNWFRIVLDEAHLIRNSSTSMAVAACALSAERRWVVTGTPVQNRLEDLGSLIKFLRIKPFDQKTAFAQYILAPFKTGDVEILPKLRLLVDSITLRRLKDNIDLPDRKDLILRLDFSKEEMELYKLFVKDSKDKVKALTSREKLSGRSYAQILKSIMRMRLICAHGEELLNDEDRKLLEGLTSNRPVDLTGDDDDDEPVDMTPKQAFEMVELLRTSGIDLCLRCNKKIGRLDEEDDDSDDDEVRADTNTIGYLTSCYHIICPTCYPDHLAEIEQKIEAETLALAEQGIEDAPVSTYHCDSCRDEVRFYHYTLKQSELDAEAAERARIRANPKLARQLGFYRGPHTKTTELVRQLKMFEQESLSRPREPPIKSVVFSTWTSHLDLIQFALTASNIKYTRLDGTMSRKNRSVAINDFTNDPETTVILVTIGAGGLGLNLTAASKAFVMEPQFNPAAEQQAVDRVHRLGQTRDVTITRFIMRDSFEENMLLQQEKKIELADLAVNRNKKMDKAEAAKEKLDRLKSLFR